MRNRYYDPATGKFTQEDPIGLAGGLNLYGFADGDPINFSDPFGLVPDLIFDIAAIAMDVVDIARNGLSWGRVATLGVDAAAAVVPGVPALAGLSGRAARGSSRVLRRSLEAAGEIAARGDHAHHIVASADRRAAPARAILEKFGIDVNSAANGVFMNGGAHQAMHTDEYYRGLNSRLSQAGSRDEALEILGDIKRELSSGGT
jgi:uncharacterized protein RhaS with RHS repeats